MKKTIRLRVRPGGRPDQLRARVREDADLSRLARALGHPARVRILRLLLTGGECLCGDIVDRIPLAQATVSQHLKVLKDSGWIDGEIDGPRVCYCARPGTAKAFVALIESLTSTVEGSKP